MLSQKQSDFLEYYANNDNDLEKCLKDLNAPKTELFRWLKDDEFKQIYDDKNISWQLFIKESNNQKALLEIHRVLCDGKITSRKSKIGVDGRLESLEIMESPIPVAYLQMSINDSSIEQAISKLLNEGMIPDTVAKRVISLCRDYQRELKKSFNTEDVKKISDTRVMALIQRALGLEKKALDE